MSRNELNFELKRSQAQFAYFQMGAAGSAIAYAVHETVGQSLYDLPYPLILAVFAWGASFVLGCLGEDARMKGMVSNIALLDFTDGLLPQAQQSDDLKVAVQRVKSRASADAAKPHRRFKAQMWLLFAGAALYVAGHGIQMAKVPSAVRGQVGSNASHLMGALPNKGLPTMAKSDSPSATISAPPSAKDDNQ